MKNLSAIPVQYDILDGRGNVIVKAYRLADGRWNFHDLKRDQWEESLDRLEPWQLISAYVGIRSRLLKAMKSQ